MAAAGVVAVIEPAFWLGQPRTNIGSFIDYYSSLIGWERFRAAQFGIRHYCTMGLNSKEANNEALADEVLEILPRFASRMASLLLAKLAMTIKRRLKTKPIALSLSSLKNLKCRSWCTPRIATRKAARSPVWM